MTPELTMTASSTSGLSSEPVRPNIGMNTVSSDIREYRAKILETLELVICAVRNATKSTKNFHQEKSKRKISHLQNKRCNVR